MYQEIERKFLVRGDYKSHSTGSSGYMQAYICSSVGRTVRVRISGSKGYLTIKGPGSKSGASRFEWEKEISVDEARALLQIAEPGIIEKTRWLVPAGDGVHTWEVDEFHGENSGLVVAEIELRSEDDKFPVPDWVGAEVTGERKYYNSELIKHPYHTWK